MVDLNLVCLEAAIYREILAAHHTRATWAASTIARVVGHGSPLPDAKKMAAFAEVSEAVAERILNMALTTRAQHE
jgi:hypothetical protein